MTLVFVFNFLGYLSFGMGLMGFLVSRPSTGYLNEYLT